MSRENLAWLLTHIPAVIMVLMLVYDYNYWKLLTSYSGYFAIGFFIVTLALNPLKAFRPKWTWVLKLNRYRRQLGVASFSYTAIHLTCFIIKRITRGFMEGLIYFLHPAIIPAFWLALPILLALALTSNQYSIQRLTFAGWKRLHKTVYIAEISIMLHLILSGETLLMLVCFGPLCILQFVKRIRRNN